MENLERAEKETEEFSEEMRQKVEKAKNMDISDLKGTVLQRYQELTDDEMGILESLEQHPVGEVIMKLIGPELTEIFSDDAPEGETDKMLAEELPRAYERAPMEDTRDTMYSAGPNPEQYRVDPSRPEFKRPRPEEVDPMMKREMASR